MFERDNAYKEIFLKKQPTWKRTGYSPKRNFILLNFYLQQEHTVELSRLNAIQSSFSMY